MKRVLTFLGIVLLFVAIPGIARAHAELESSTPADGEVLSAAPAEVSLTFGEELLPDFVNVVATDAAGAVTELTVTSIDGPTATMAWPVDLPGGDWRVDYRVVSQDGHPVEGSIAFSYPATSPTASPTASPTSATPAPDPTSQSPTPAPTSAEPSPTTTPAADESPTSPGWIIAGVAVLVLVIIAVVGLVVRRRSP